MGAASSCDCFGVTDASANGGNMQKPNLNSRMEMEKLNSQDPNKKPDRVKYQALANEKDGADGSRANQSRPNASKDKSKQKGQKKLDLTDFSMNRVIGRGSFGKVYLVQKKDNKQIYALKALKKEDILKRNQVENALIEKNIMQQATHPFVVNLRFSFQNQQNLYLVMDFMPGGELFMHLRRMKKFEEDTTRFYASEVVMALEYLHTELDIVYRDLKPENILLDGDGHIKLTDFGLSKNTKLSYSFCGTPEYLAPEILLGKGHSKEVDWWSLGCLIYEMLAGYPPFQNKNRKQLYQDILKNDPLIPSHFSSNARNLLSKLLVSNPAERLGHASIDEIKKHPFFSKTDWQELLQKKSPGPIIPEVKNPNDLKNFDKSYLQEPVAETPMHDIRFMHDPRNYFENFSYNPQTLMGGDLGEDGGLHKKLNG